jgi:UDP-2,4-diacetamido-2,4,6-trideoxy-beta-L-altropyranose hydrolase
MHVAIRVDASAAIGTGHLKRCLSLAQAMAEAGAHTLFVCRLLDSVAAHMLATQDVAVHWLPAPHSAFKPVDIAAPHATWAGVSSADDVQQTVHALAEWHPDWVVVDHYAFDACWHRPVRQALGCRLLVIDDLADRPIDADALLDHNWDADHRRKYAARVQRSLTWLTGPRHALLAPVYRWAPRCTLRAEVRSIGIFLGGTDPGGASARAVQACRAAGFGGPLEVVSTLVSPHLPDLRLVCAADSATTLTLDEPDLAAFFARHDLQIGAGGGATWERCCVGAPTIGLVLAANQAVIVPALDRLGALRAARFDDVPEAADLPALSTVLCQLVPDAAARAALGQRATTLVDGRGAQRVALSLLGGQLQLRSATLDDARLLHGWRNHSTVRAVSTTQNPIAIDAHERWMLAVLSNPARWLFVGLVGPLPVGSIRFDRLTTGFLEVSFYLDPDLQGLGLGQHLLAAGEQALLARHPQGFTVVASVLPGNAVSQRMFEASGYHGGPLHYQKNLGPLQSLTRSKHENSRP